MSKTSRKTVVLYLAETKGEPNIVRPNEIISYRWADIVEAKTLLHYDYGKLLDEFMVSIKELKKL